MTADARPRRRTEVVRADFIDTLIANVPGARELRSHRGFVKEQLARAIDAIFHPVIRDYGFSAHERALVALYVSLLHADDAATRYFAQMLETFGATEEQFAAVEEYARLTRTAGPYGRYPAGGALARENDPGPEAEAADRSRLGPRLAVGLAHAHLLLLHPRDAQAGHLDRLKENGWGDSQIVILTQIVAVLSFQLRVAAGLRAVAGLLPPAGLGPGRASGDGEASFDDRPLDPRRPPAFTSEIVAWRPWIAESETDENPGFDWKAVFGGRRASSPSFRLSARDPLIALPLSRIENDVFSGAGNGLDRGERELGALAVSRYNGCVYCASVHARTTAKFTARVADAERFLAEGFAGSYGERWDAFIAAARTLTHTPPAIGTPEVERLRGHGLDDEALLDFIHSVGYFNFANRIMLGLGDPILQR